MQGMIFLYRIYSIKFSRTIIFMDVSSTAKLHPAKCLADVCMSTCATLFGGNVQLAYSLDVSLLRKVLASGDDKLKDPQG